MTIFTWIFHILVILLLGHFIVQKYSIPKSLGYLGLALKLGCGVGVGLLYWYYYQFGDTIRYFNAALEFNEQYLNPVQYLQHLFQSEVQAFQYDGRARFFVRIIAPILLVTGNVYWIAGAYLSLFCFWGSVRAICTVNEYFSRIPFHFLAFLFFPSVLFWSSGLIKESIILGALFQVFSIVLSVHLSRKLSVWTIFQLVIFMTVLILLRHFLGGLTLVFSALIFLDTFIPKKLNSVTRLIISGIILTIGLASMKFFHVWLNLNRLPLTILENNNAILEGSNSSNIIELNLEPTYLSLLINSPKAFFLGLFGPFHWTGDFIISLMSTEGIILLCFVLLSIFSCIKYGIQTPSRIVIWISLFVLILAVIIPLSVPNYGSISRYRVTFLPFLLTNIYLSTKKVDASELR